MSEAAFGFAARGHEVEVLTTTARDHFSWANELPEGVFQENGLLVRRFGVVRRPSRVALAAQVAIGEGNIPGLDEQVSWLGFQFASPGLFEHLARHGDAYDAIVFSPYLFWNTTACLPMVAERAVAMPCLHDESYARLDVVRPGLARAALVWFLSGPEHHLAHRLGPVAPRHSVTGAGVPVPRAYDPDGFREKYKLERPFALCAGRREAGKGVAWLAETFPRASTGLDLVVIGKGEALPPAEGVVDLGFVPDEDRNNAFAAASAYVQPSRVESFSRTVMEAWLAGAPVVAFSEGEVVAWHVRRSGGGVLFSDAGSLEACLAEVAERGAELGAAGRRYVLENYSWPAVLDRMEASLGAALPARSTSVARASPKPPCRRALVAGSYPPVPGEPAAATVAAVRRAWAAGGEVVVASPRPSAAAHVLSRLGTGLGAELACLAAREHCDELVVCFEPGWPLLADRPAGPTVAALGRAFAQVGRGELVVSGDLADWEALAGRLAPLWPALVAVTASSAALAGLLERAGAPSVHVVEPYAASGLAAPPPTWAPAGPLEPGELLWRTRARRLAGRCARGLLGRHAPTARQSLSALARAVRGNGRQAW
jgi:glycosyltransferase involved in cell wall biosynthesis